MSDATREAAAVAIDVLLQEKREFLPSPEFVRTAVVSDPAVYDQADRDLDGFWLARANEFVSWATPPTKALEWDPPHCTWFADGALNVSYNCLDRHVEAGRGDKVAFHFVSEPVDEDDRASWATPRPCATRPSSRISSARPTPCCTQAPDRAAPDPPRRARADVRRERGERTPALASRPGRCAAAGGRARDRANRSCLLEPVPARNADRRAAGQTIAVASHGNLIALALHLHDPAIGFAFWRSMPMPAVYRMQRE